MNLKDLKGFLVLVVIFMSSAALAETNVKIFAEPYLEKSVAASAQLIGGGVNSQNGDADSFSIGSKLGVDLFGFSGGVSADYTSAIATNDASENTGFDVKYQSFDLFIGYTFFDVLRISYFRTISGKASVGDGKSRDVTFDSNKISLGYYLNKKAFLEVSRVEKFTEAPSGASNYADRADLFDTYTVGLTFPIELF